MSFIHPGRLYLRKRGAIESAEDIFNYADFLRVEAGVDGVIPVDIDGIFQHFGIPTPKFAPLPDQQGLLFNAESGIIIINSEDPATRQKFSKAHELVELLFAELPQGLSLGGGWFLHRPGGFKEKMKETLCNQTAADLLMPPSEIQTRIQLYGSNFDSGRLIATDFEVSLSAALVQIARLSSDSCAVILWQMKNKPSELKKQPDRAQLKLTGFDLVEGPTKKLRVVWSFGGTNTPYIPIDKSIDNNSHVFMAWECNIFTYGDDYLTFDGRSSALYRTENQPFTVEGEKMVLSFIRKLKS